MHIGPVIRQLRKQKGVSQKEMAEKVGVSHTHLCCIENESRDNTNLELIEKMCAYLGVTVSELFRLVEGGKSYMDGVQDTKKIISSFLDRVEWATYKDLQTLFIDNEERTKVE